MKKFLYILFFLFLTDIAFAESKIEKIKNKIKAGEDKLIGKKDLQRIWILRKILDDMTNVEAMEFILGKLKRTKSNREFLDSMST